METNVAELQSTIVEQAIKISRLETENTYLRRANQSLAKKVQELSSSITPAAPAVEDQK